MTEALTERQRRYVHGIARGLDSQAAAREAGYSDTFARVASHRLGKKPAVAEAIAAIRREGMKAAVYDLETAMAEANAVCDFAILHKSPMAYCKGTELRAKLSGLLIDRVEIATVDLTGALARAEARVLNGVNAEPLSARRSIDWLAKIPGNEAKQIEADGESDGQVKRDR